MASYHVRVKSGKKGTAEAHAAYIARQGSYASRGDLVESGYGNMPWWADGRPHLFWKAADRYERTNGAAYREYQVALPKELSIEDAVELCHQITQLLAGNKPFQLAIHAPKSSLEGEINLHVHLMISERMDDGIDRSPAQMFSRYNRKYPEMGGRQKDGCGMDWMEVRGNMIDLRRALAKLQNSALAGAGYDSRVDHRSLAEQGIERDPERHLGQTRIKRFSEQDKQAYLDARRYPFTPTSATTPASAES